MDSSNLVGKSLAGCTLLASIGRGSMGEVYRGVHQGLQREVAVKVVLVESRGKEAVDRLLAEARALAKIEHPNVVHVYDVGLQGDLFYIVMQFLKGTTLKDRFEESGALETAEVYGIVSSVARGLGAIHDEGLLHRDLKMENVFLVEDGTARIMDFGLAVESGGKDEHEGKIVGTPPYIPPEIWLGRPADGRSDLYSLGVILYALLCGDYPFRAKSPREYRELHLKAVPKDPAEIKPEIGEDLAAVVLKLLARNRAGRYASVQEFLKDFDQCRRGSAPAVAHDTGRKQRCGFCESINPAKAKKCSVCGEMLGAPAELTVQPRADELVCPGCGVIRDRRLRACPKCKKVTCSNCLRGIAVRDNLCAECLAI